VDEVPETRYAKVGRDHIAYQVLGEGALDLIYVPSLGDCIDMRWEWPPYASFLRRLASFSRLIMFDRRGMGASDPVPLDALPSWEEWADDLRAVMDAVDSERAAVFGNNESTAAALLFAATRPERTQALVLFNGSARVTSEADYTGARSTTDLDELTRLVEEAWGTDAVVQVGSLRRAEDPVFTRWLSKMTRMACSPREAAAYIRATQLMDVRSVLPSIRVPTLVLHRKENPRVPVDVGRYLADHLPDARFVVVPGSDVHPFVKPTAQILDEVEAFLTGAPLSAETDRALAAVLFTDIVGSTERAVELGDKRWRSLLEGHDAVARTIIEEHRGRLVKLTGDGALATFDGPGRAIRCVVAMRDALDTLGIKIRAGLHTGEIEVRGEDIGGIGVHVAARVMDHAGPGEILTSPPVPLLVAGSGIEFDDRGEHELKGVPGTWKLFAVQA
jgi:class 3 adenylate cyclase